MTSRALLLRYTVRGPVLLSLRSSVPTPTSCHMSAVSTPGEAGDAAAEALIVSDRRVSRVRPSGAKDWNEILKRDGRA